MGKIDSKRRATEIRQKQKLRRKLQALKERYHATRDRAERQRILEKIARLAPYLSPERYVAD